LILHRQTSPTVLTTHSHKTHYHKRVASGQKATSDQKVTSGGFP
jgi:hypothetical protein